MDGQMHYIFSTEQFYSARQAGNLCCPPSCHGCLTIT